MPGQEIRCSIWNNESGIDKQKAEKKKLLFNNRKKTLKIARMLIMLATVMVEDEIKHLEKQKHQF